MFKVILLFFFFTLTISAQINAKILNSEDKTAVPYVSIWDKNGAGGTTADENGNFKIEKTENAEFLFKAIGYKDQTINVQAIKNNTVYLEPEIYTLPEVRIRANKTISTKIGKLKKGSHLTAFGHDNTSRIVAKYFKFDEKYEATPFLKSVSLKTNSSLKNAIFNLKFYATGTDKEPKELLYKKNILCKVKKGNNITKIDVSELDIEFPEQGIFIAVEVLLLEQNKYGTEYAFNSKENRIFYIYMPILIMADAETEEGKDSWSFDGKMWKKTVHSLVMAFELSN